MPFFFNFNYIFKNKCYFVFNLFQSVQILLVPKHSVNDGDQSTLKANACSLTSGHKTIFVSRLFLGLIHIIDYSEDSCLISSLIGTT